MLTAAGDNAFTLTGNIDMQGSGDLARNLLAAAKGKSSLHLDLSAVERADSAALAMLFAVARVLEEQGGLLKISGLPAKLESLVHLYGVETIMRKYTLEKHKSNEHKEAV